MKEKIKLLIVDDGLALIESLRYILEMQTEVFERVAIANNKENALHELLGKKYNLLLLDLSFNDSSYDGSDIARIVKEKYPTIRICIFTNNVKLFIYNELIDTIGVNGIIDKESSLDVTIKGLKAIHNGKQFIDPSVTNTLNKSQLSELSKTELTVLHFLSEGLSHKEIGKKRETTENTIRNQVSNISLKLNMTTKQLISFYNLYKVSARENFNETMAPFQKKKP